MSTPNMINYETRNNVLKEFKLCDQVFGFFQVFAEFVKTGVLQNIQKNQSLKFSDTKSK